MSRNPLKRVYAGENMAYGVVHWLNLTRDTRARRNIVALLETSNKLQEFYPKADLPLVSLNPFKPGLHGTKAQRRDLKLLGEYVRKLNRLVSKYKVYPRFSVTRDKYWDVSWANPTNRGKVQIEVFARGNYDTFTFGEGDVLFRIMRLAELGYLHRVRRCYCGNWFFARFKHQRFCGTPCQQRDFRSTEEFKAERREYMRGYRRLTEARRCARA